MSYWRDNYGNIYGPFNKQDDEFPNAGEVVRFYREKMKLSQTRLALLLRVDRTWIIKMEHQNKVPELLSRRRAIADLLQIPPVLLGVSALGSDTFLELVELHASSRPSVAPYSLQEAREYLDAVWDAYTFTGSIEVLPGVLRWKGRIDEDVKQKARDENLNLLHRYELFLLEIGRQRKDYTGTNPTKLINLARQIENPDTLGTSLYHRGKMHFQQKNYDAALIDVQKAMTQVTQAGPQVKGLVLVGSGTVLAHYATDKADVQNIMRNIDKAWKCVDESKGYPDLFRAKFDRSRYFIARASSLIPLLRIDSTLIDEIWEALSLAQEITQPQHVRRRAHIELLYADAAFHTGEYLSATGTAVEALELARSVDLLWNIEDIQALYNRLTQTKIKDSAELRELRRALLKK